ncbi:MAG: class I SAM-dependent methyltransferase [Deltaproteobacteria bacterium]|nr:class I SAM-dependent methyltransferase [Deltaproteobacteria bacterium]
MSPPAFAYDDVPYEDFPVTESHVDTLYVEARRAGLDAVPPRRARILELGCAHAVNLIPMAFDLPQAQCLGIDLSPKQIERGRAHVQSLGLSNLELRCADVMELELGARRFDYVIAHGLYSWVPEPVRARVLTLCRDHLAEGGVAYLSYNAMPAWGIRGAIARALLQGVGAVEDVFEKVRRARAVLARLEQVQPLRGTAEGALMKIEIDALRDVPDSYLLHEYLVPCSRAFYLCEVVERAQQAGLRWIGDVAPGSLSPAERRRTRAALEGLADDPLVAEQLTDIVGFRQFRASLLCRADASLATPPSWSELLADSFVAAPPADPSPGDSAEVRVVLDALGQRWPRDLPLDVLAEGLGGEVASVVDTLGSLIADGRVRLRPRSLPIVTEPGEQPGVSALARFESQHRSFVTTPLHEHSPLDVFHSALVALLDGLHTRAALVEALADDIEAGRLKLTSEHVPTRAQLSAALVGMVERGLNGLALTGMLTA